MRGFAEWAAFGVIGEAGASRCIECRASHPGAGKCDGFGPGCFLPRPIAPERADDEYVTFSSIRRPPVAR